jgi:hypothetical protein
MSDPLANICSVESMWSQEIFDAAQEMLLSGFSTREVSRRTGVPRRTITHWRRSPPQLRTRRSIVRENWRPPAGPVYCYVLGLYLGDGHIVERRTSAFLRITLDARYKLMVREASAALVRVLPDAPVRQYGFSTARKVILQVSHPVLPFAFPQHGRGRKHKRHIALTEWQSALTRRDPRPFIRGLIHSDGCRSINRFSTELPSGRMATYEYVRYFFTNLSADIRGIFCAHCELINIRCTQSSFKNISIADRSSVRRLDAFVGPKS